MPGKNNDKETNWFMFAFAFIVLIFAGVTIASGAFEDLGCDAAPQPAAPYAFSIRSFLVTDGIIGVLLAIILMIGAFFDNTIMNGLVYLFSLLVGLVLPIFGSSYLVSGVSGCTKTFPEAMVYIATLGGFLYYLMIQFSILSRFYSNDGYTSVTGAQQPYAGARQNLASTRNQRTGFMMH